MGARHSARRTQLASVRGLIALDSGRPRRRPAAWSGDRHRTPGEPPSGVFVAVSHWCSPADSPVVGSSSKSPRLSRILLECVESLLGLDVDRVVVAIVTNEPQQTAENLSTGLAANDSEARVSVLPSLASFERPRTEPRQVMAIGWHPGLIRRHGFYLTWAHKSLFARALGDAGLSHFVYLEDDIRFNRESLTYWCRFREPLAAHGLLPGFVRYETLDGARYVVDQKRRQSVGRSAGAGTISTSELDRSEPELRFVSLENPYQGMYVLDRELAVAHLSRSPARSPLLSRGIRWPTGVQERAAIVRERAAMGPIFDQVPAGFGSRNVVPVHTPRPGEHRLDSACLVEHLTGNYSRSDSPFGKIRVEELFLAAGDDPRAVGSSPRQ